MNLETDGRGEIVIYQTTDGNTELEVRLVDDNVWLHIRNIFKEGELSSSSTVKEYLTVQQEGRRSVRRQVSFYNFEWLLRNG